MAYIPKSSLNGDLDGPARLENSKPVALSEIQPGDIQAPKKSWFRNVAGDLLYSEGENLGDMIMTNIIEPGIKNTISSTITEVFDGIKNVVIAIICGSEYVSAKNYQKGGPYVSYGSRYNPNKPSRDIPFDGGTYRASGGGIFSDPVADSGFYRNIVFKKRPEEITARGRAEVERSDIIYLARCYGTYRVSSLKSKFKLDAYITATDTQYGWTSDMLNNNSIKLRPGAHGDWIMSMPDPIYMEG